MGDVGDQQAERAILLRRRDMRVFIGSTSEQKALVEWATKFMREEKEFVGKLEPVPWTTPWPGGHFTLESILSFAAGTDASILFLTADDKTTFRGADRHEPRDNMVFEAGLFTATHGAERTGLLVAKYPDVVGQKKGVALPTDLAGLTYDSFAWHDTIDTSGLPATMRTVCLRLVSLGPRPKRIGTIVDNLAVHRDSIESLYTAVGDWRTINSQAIQVLAADSSSLQIDVLAAYRVGDLRRALGDFRTRRGRLRACFANMWDDSLLAVYQRKYHDRDSKHIRDALVESIHFLLGPCSVDPQSPHKIVISDLSAAPLASYEIYLTSQRITFGYYRVDGTAFIVPLDMKKAQDPAPPVWVLPRAGAPRAFDAYLQSYEQVLNEALHVFP